MTGLKTQESKEFVAFFKIVQAEAIMAQLSRQKFDVFIMN